MKVIPFTEALAFAKARGVVLPDNYYGERVGIARAQARTISDLAGVDQIQYVFDRLDAVVKAGGTFRDFQKKVAAGEETIALPRHRLELVFRNAVQTNYMAGRWQQVQGNKSHRPYLRYIAINDGRTRPSHKRMHGHIAAVDDPWWSTHHPQNGHNCRCGVQAITEAEAKRRGIASTPPKNAQPDKGWDYNAGMAPMDGVKKAAEAKKKTVDKVLVGAIDAAVAPITVPVSSALVAMQYKRISKHVLSVIDRVHTDGDLPTIPINRTTGKSSFFQRRGNTPLSIAISSKQKGMQHHALVHEIGHFIDFGVLEGKASGIVLEQAKKSSAILKLQLMLKITTIAKDRDFYAYLLKDTEIWARCYTQWVTTKSGDSILQEELKDIMGDHRQIMQWNTEDFIPIMALIDDFMVKKGWSNEQKDKKESKRADP